ncbi:Asperlicin C monooxygenase [Exophiala dermatitidis]
MRSLSIDLVKHGFRIHKYTGEHIITQPTPPQDPDAPVFNGHRGELHEVVFNYAKDDLKIPIHLGQRVEKYIEEEDRAGIELTTGEKVYGDVVIGSDGVRSKARELVLGFPNTDMIADSRTKHFCDNGDTFNGWIGQDVHFLFSTIKNGSDCCWVLTHKDEADIDESWSFPGKLEDVYKVFEGWDPLCKTIVSKTPESHLVDWKLVYRDPLPTWISKGGRIALLGDSAHPFLPTSAQGATQAMEDGVTIAICLRRAGKEDVPDAVRTYQRIRYDRVKAVQKTGETTRDMWHKADWEKVKKDPESVQFPRQDWIHGFDAEKHAEEVFDQELGQVKAAVNGTHQAGSESAVTEKIRAEPDVTCEAVAVPMDHEAEPVASSA